MKKYRHLLVDLLYIAISIIVAVFLLKNGIGGAISNSENHALASFVAGIFFTSAFTIAPAAAVLGVLALKTSPLIVALFGAMGAVLGDLIIFTFVKDRFAYDLASLMGAEKKKLRHLIHMRIFRWLMPLVGAIIIASPLPDELGLLMLGISKTKTKILIPISFAMNFIGVLLVALVAEGIK